MWQLLKMESPSGQDCHETLSLLRLYGPDGQRYEDSRVVQEIRDKEQPTGKPYKRFLRLLRSIDEDWEKENPPPGQVGGSPGTSGSGDGPDEDSMDGDSTYSRP